MIYHVLNRSVARIRLFRSEKDYAAYISTLTEAINRTPIELLAFCVMPNHWHLVLRPARDGDLSAFMQWLTLTHTQRWRTAHDTVGYGPLYQGRFKAFVIQEDLHLLTVLRYVERNPLRAALVTRAEQWRWSSLYQRLAGQGADGPALAPWPLPISEDWTDRVNAPQSSTEEADFRTSIDRSRPFGSPTWQRRAAKELNLTSCFRQRGRPARQERPDRAPAHTATSE
jgi:putative transposase